jgi:NitT/TauT family transport system permease protein
MPWITPTRRRRLASSLDQQTGGLERVSQVDLGAGGTRNERGAAEPSTAAPGRLGRNGQVRGQRRRPRRKLRIFGEVDPRARFAITLGSFAFLIGAWWIASAVNVASDIFLPSPYAVGRRFVDLAQSGTLGPDIWASFKRIMIGFALSTVVAIPIGALIGIYRGAEAAVEPVVGFIRYMPAVAFIPLTIVWVGLGEEQKYLMVWIGTFFQQVLMVQDDVKRVPREYADIGYTLGMKEPRIISRIVLPAAAPAIWDTLRITLGWAWTYLVVAELVAASSGLGYRSLVAQRFFQTDVIFVVVLVIGFLGLIMDQLMRLVGLRVFRWAEKRR